MRCVITRDAWDDGYFTLQVDRGGRGIRCLLRLGGPLEFGWLVGLGGLVRLG